LTIEDRWISEEEKAERLATALASAYVPYDEDSYGYPTIEAAHAARCTVTVADSGGVPEFVKDGVTGLNVTPDPTALAAAFDRLHGDRALARLLGEAARAQIGRLGIEWDTVVAKLLA
jgi:glycosyltransferase involved in cell wall biosynthesis